MIRTLLLAVAVSFFGMAANAQQLISQKDLIGDWHIQAVDGQGIYYDFKKDSLGLSDSLAELVGEESLPALKEHARDSFEEEFGGSISFGTDGKVRSFSRGKKQTDYYRLFVRNKVQYLSITSAPNGEDGDAIVRMENGLLIMSHRQKGSGTISVVLSR